MTPPAHEVTAPAFWRTAEDLVAIGAQRSRLVLVNEARSDT
jgi:hypothetical protein